MKGRGHMQAISGIMVYYYYVCKRKLWYYAHHLGMEFNSELVGLGKLTDEDSYSQNHKHILIDDSINIDFFMSNYKVVHEVKKSRSIEPASIWQLKYYMFVLEEKGVSVEKGILDYPLLKRRETVFLDDEDRKELHCTLESICEIIHSPTPPNLSKMGVCKNCSYFELCFI